MILYVNGCSHSEDISSIKNENYTWPILFMDGLSKDYQNCRVIGDQLNNRNDNTYINLDNVSSDILINDSVCGAGNDYIFHKSLESLNILLQKNHKPDYVVIQWSGPNRREWCDIDGNIKFVTLYDNIDLYLKFEPMGSLHSLHYIYSLQEFLKSNNINYMFFNYMGLDYSIKSRNIFGEIDTSRILDFDNNTLFNGLINLFKEKSYTRDLQGHPNKDGFDYITKKLVEKFLI